MSEDQVKNKPCETVNKNCNAQITLDPRNGSYDDCHVVLYNIFSDCDHPFILKQKRSDYKKMTTFSRQRQQPTQILQKKQSSTKEEKGDVDEDETEHQEKEIVVDVNFGPLHEQDKFPQEVKLNVKANIDTKQNTEKETGGWKQVLPKNELKQKHKRYRKKCFHGIDCEYGSVCKFYHTYDERRFFRDNHF